MKTHPFWKPLVSIIDPLTNSPQVVELHHPGVPVVLERAFGAYYEVRADGENASHSKRCAALSSSNFDHSGFGCALVLARLLPMSKGERQTRRRIDAHSSL